MIPLQIIVSISSIVLENGLYNAVCKKDLHTDDHRKRFNTIAYAVCVLLFGVGVVKDGISPLTAALGLVFGIVTALSYQYRMHALSEGPMHITLLVTTSSMIIPALSGIFFGESISPLKLAAIFVLLFFIYLSFGKSRGDGVNKKWMLFVSLAFIFQGSIGVLQKVHQSTSYSSELNGFLFVAFSSSLVFSLIGPKRGYKALGFKRRHLLIGIVCGVCAYTMNILNLRLSGILPSQLFFPLINGSSVILGALTSIVLFRERITRKQTVGLVGGVAALIAICLI